MNDKQYPKDYFSLIQDNERLLDKPLQTKQLSYFQDAMMRFTKNKYNVIASIILLIMVILSITVPMITPKNLYMQTNSSLTTLPPKVPFLSEIGIFDGTKDYDDQPIDVDTIDPETGLGYPTLGFDVEYIDLGTLTNREIIGSERSPLYIGGTNDLYINYDKIAYAIKANDFVTIIDGTTLELEVVEIDTTGVIKVYFLDSSIPEPTSWDEYTLLGTITTSGTHEIDMLPTLTAGDTGKIVVKYEIPTPSVNGSEFISLNSITVKYPNAEDNIVYTGYDLSSFSLIVVDPATENGRYLRKDAAMTVASFTYDVYAALFADAPKIIGAEEYNQIIADNPGMEDTITLHPEDPEMWTFGDGYPLRAVTSIDSITIAGTVYSNYHVMMNGTYAIGFETEPNFLFGTDVFGKDLFTLIWLGLRTSLLLGVLASISNIIVGVIWGAFSAYYGGQVDILMERFTDIWGSFPQITMIGIITVLIGPGFLALFIFMVYDGWIGVAKVTRLQFYRYKGREYVLAARTLGASDRRIIFKHILPNTLGTIVTRVILSIPSVIFLEVNLSYLGFGIGNGQSLTIGPLTLTGTSIGVILNDGQQQIFAGNLWLIIYPTIIVSILMITFNMFGNALRDALNPQLRGSE